ncbi:hypothetical protein CANARDRAFT_30641 [[Candida] arabinofermentans NRRL YB-2248]|uniref:Dynactin subunit 5 n=1 Tax=[Candida] arabinofermentans NRRL YB-2248 TaxID=983967 RepID=A0A1E4ST24_9ASCO|nr:hypothetical protein CANARDRAFT_30641 [[Candida] arabinofermentans NRRL YB-2248]
MDTVTNDDKQWIETSSGNRIHKTCQIKGSNRITIQRNTTIDTNSTISVINQDNTITIGKFCFISNNVTLKSSSNSVKIGSYTLIDSGSKLQNCRSIGNRVRIGKNCVIGKGCIIHDCCSIEDNVRIPANYTIPPFSLVKYISNHHNHDEVESLNFEIAELDESFKKIHETSVKNMVLLGEEWY